VRDPVVGIVRLLAQMRPRRHSAPGAIAAAGMGGGQPSGRRKAGWTTLLETGLRTAIADSSVTSNARSGADTGHAGQRGFVDKALQGCGRRRLTQPSASG